MRQLLIMCVAIATSFTAVAGPASDASAPVASHSAQPAALAVRQWNADGRCAVLLHPLTANSALFATWATALQAQGYRVAAPDLPGH